MSDWPYPGIADSRWMASDDRWLRIVTRLVKERLAAFDPGQAFAEALGDEEGA